MPNGLGFGRGCGRGMGLGRRRGFGFGRGMGFGFRGWSPPWPYVGQGRGGLPRHEYFMRGGAGPYGEVPYSDYAAVTPPTAGPAPYPFYEEAPVGTMPGVMAGPGAAPFSPNIPQEQELDFLKNEAEAIKGQLGQIEARMREMETGN